MRPSPLERVEHLETPLAAPAPAGSAASAMPCSSSRTNGARAGPAQEAGLGDGERAAVDDRARVHEQRLGRAARSVAGERGQRPRREAGQAEQLVALGRAEPEPGEQADPHAGARAPANPTRRGATRRRARRAARTEPRAHLHPTRRRAAARQAPARRAARRRPWCGSSSRPDDPAGHVADTGAERGTQDAEPSAGALAPTLGQLEAGGGEEEDDEQADDLDEHGKRRLAPLPYRLPGGAPEIPGRWPAPAATAGLRRGAARLPLRRRRWRR